MQLPKNRPIREPWFINTARVFQVVTKIKWVLTLLVTVSLAALALTGIDKAIAARTNCESVRKSYPFGIALNKVSIGTSRSEVCASLLGNHRFKFC